MKKTVLLILLGTAAVGSIHAQSIGPSTLNAAGGTAVIGTNEFDWSVGEMTLVNTFTNSGIIVTQGVLQPAGYSNEGVANNSLLSKQLQVFPNPASTVVNIEYTSPVQGTLTYKLTDIAGKAITGKTINVQQGKTAEQVNVSELANATYMLEITANPGGTGSESISYKIEKRN